MRRPPADGGGGGVPIEALICGGMCAMELSSEAGAPSKLTAGGMMPSSARMTASLSGGASSSGVLPACSANKSVESRSCNHHHHQAEGPLTNCGGRDNGRILIRLSGG